MGLLKRLFKPASERGEAAPVDPLVDRVVAVTDPRLVHLKGYRDALRAPVGAAHERMREAIALIPGPIEVGAGAWSGDATLRPLFARADDVAPAFSNDAGVRAFFESHPGADCYAMLGLRKVERKVLTSELHGDAVHADAARTTVSFNEPQTLAPGGDEATVRAELAGRAIEYLALRALERVTGAKAEKQDLEQERALLQARLRLEKRGGAGLGAMAEATEGIGSAGRAALERDIERLTRELQHVASQALLPNLLEQLRAAYERPEDYLVIEPSTLVLDAMNFVVAASAQAVAPCIAMLKLAGRGDFAVLIARFPRAEFQAGTPFADAAKYL